MWLSFYWKTFLLNFTQRLRNRSQVKSMRLNPPFIKHVAFLIYSHHSFLFKFGNKYTIIFKIFWEFLMFYQIFLSPQVKQWTIISCKHFIYYFIYKQKSIEKQKLNFFRSALSHMKTRVSLKYFVNDYLWKTFFCL